MADIRFAVSDDYLSEFQKHSMEGYITSYTLELDFFDEVEVIGVINIIFDVIGYGIDGFDGGIDISYQVMYFQDPLNKEDYLDDNEAFIYIFSNYGNDIMTVVNLAYDALDDFYTNGTPLNKFAYHFK
ncbi:hypothetical protein FJQ98_16505 [Lysinibacillus agricola]|uniref:CDI immunity protein domain-containing protein n=1 Tax=Lysinibacillus agricola TaxID=2590012 RepID=A0ABX7ANI4_9BACI|nr:MULTISPECIES: hypothetical protein [Lysinibacillus]KOS61469.1 hypothetical protein AN161_17920 [Lysinibacillus sp. FJAT-14222]QQP10847.1 hypothetical protein FJQ98_16505 [Lysinibacillus agricola]